MSNVEVSSGGLSATSASGLPVGTVRALIAIGLMILGFALFLPTTLSLNVRWQDTVARAYTHGYLIVAISLWLLWRGRAAWAQPRVKPSIPAFLCVIAGGLVWLIAYRAGLQIVHQALLPCIIAAAVWTCFGWPLTRRMALPLAYLGFAIPLWDAINPLLQSMSTMAVRVLLGFVGVPAYFVGNTFQIPAGSFEIADGCSGLHFFIVAIAIAVLYGEVNRDSLRTRVKLVVLAATLAIVTNWVRVFIIVMAGHLTDMQHSLVSKEHYTFGWFLFAGTMLLYFLIVRRWPAEDEGVDSTPAEAPTPGRSAIPLKGLGLAALGMLFAPMINALDQIGDRTAGSADANQPVTVEAPAGWVEQTPTRSWSPVFEGVDAEVRHEFRKGNVTIEAYVAVYYEQRQHKELINHGNSLLGTEMKADSQAAGPGEWQEVRAHDAAGNSWLLWYAYRVGNRWHSRPLSVQLDYATQSLYADPVSSAVLLRSRCAADCESSRAELTQFVSATWP